MSPYERVRCVPISHQFAGRSHRRSPFRTPFDKGLRELVRELDHLRARNCILQINLSHGQIRNDGWPYSSARRPEHPGVVLTFEVPKLGVLSYPCDTFDKWEDNVLAIARSLEALRMVDRYGVTKTGEQYHGFKALPPGGAAVAAAEWATAEDAARFLCTTAYGPDATGPSYIGPCLGNNGYRDDLRTIWRSAAQKAHPDVGGTDELMAKVNRAKAFIEEAR